MASVNQSAHDGHCHADTGAYSRSLGDASTTRQGVLGTSATAAVTFPVSVATSVTPGRRSASAGPSDVESDLDASGSPDRSTSTAPPPETGTMDSKYAPSGVTAGVNPPEKTRRPPSDPYGTATATTGMRRAAEGTTSDTPVLPDTAARRCAVPTVMSRPIRSGRSGKTLSRRPSASSSTAASKPRDCTTRSKSSWLTVRPASSRSACAVLAPPRP